MYSSTTKLWDYARKTRELSNEDEDGESWDKTFKPWSFKDEEPASSTIDKISYDFWDGRKTYSVSLDI